MEPFEETRFRDRTHAGQILAEELEAYRGEDAIVLALPRGGVPVAFEAARALRAPLDVYIVRKLGVPGQEELAMGALASGGTRVLNESVVRQLGITQKDIDRVTAREAEELRRREKLFRGDRPSPDIQDRTVIVIDDGLATGATMQAAVESLRERAPTKIVVAVPTAAPQVCERFRREVDDFVCILSPPDLRAIGFWYEDFTQTTDEEVQELLNRAQQWARQ